MWGQADPADLLAMWAEALGSYEADELRVALAGVGKAHPEYPPTLPQFVSLCNDVRNRRIQSIKKIAGPVTEMPPEIKEKLTQFVRDHRMPGS